MYGCIKKMKELNLIHGCISPNNIVINSSEHNETYQLRNYCLYDIGKLEDFSYEDIYYLSPEIILGKEVTIMSDIWSFGCLMFYVITGHHLFHSKNLKELVTKMNRNSYFISNNELNDKEKEIIKKFVTSDSSKRILVEEINNELERLKDFHFESNVENIDIEYIKQMAKTNTPIYDDNKILQILILGKENEKATNNPLCKEIAQLFAEENNKEYEDYYFNIFLNLKLHPMYEQISKIVDPIISSKIKDTRKILWDSFHEPIKRQKNYDSSGVKIDCSTREEGENFVHHLSAGLPSYSNLEHIYVSSAGDEEDGFTDKFVKYIVSNLDFQNNYKLREIYLPKCSISSESIKVLSNKLVPAQSQSTIPIATLYIEENDIDDRSIEYLSTAFPYMKFLSNVLIGRNKITNYGYHLLAKNMKYLDQLENLTIAANSVSDEGVLDILKNINYEHLQMLFLNENNLTDVIIDELIKHINEMKEMEILSLHSNNFSKDALEKLIDKIGKKDVMKNLVTIQIRPKDDDNNDNKENNEKVEKVDIYEDLKKKIIANGYRADITDINNS